jgi:hypothetical protein
MKRLVIAVLLIGAAALAGAFKRGQAFEKGQEVREEFTRYYQLSEDAEVTIERINGSVTVEAYDRDIAEISVTRVGESQDEIEDGLKIEASEDSLTIRGKGMRPSIWRRIFGPRMRQDVRLRLPRQAVLRIRNVNGLVVASGMDAKVDVKRVDGRVEIRRPGGELEVKGVNGRLMLDVVELPESGLRVDGVNGGVVLKVSPVLNADLTGTRICGDVTTNIPGVEITRTMLRFTARLGMGGPDVSLEDINGRVWLTEGDSYGSGITTASD